MTRCSHGINHSGQRHGCDGCCKEHSAARPCAPFCDTCTLLVIERREQHVRQREYEQGWNDALKAAIEVVAKRHPYAHGSKNCADDVRTLVKVGR